MVVIEGFFATMGGMLSTWIDLGFYLHTTGSITWRFPIGFQIVFPLMVMALVIIMPESPRWLIKKDRVAEATEVMSILDDLPVDSEELAKDVQNIWHHTKNDQVRNFRHIFQKSQKRYLHRMTLALAVQCFNQLTGIDALSYYAGQYSSIHFACISGFSLLSSGHLSTRATSECNQLESCGRDIGDLAVDLLCRPFLRR
jgi:hypothetical protein